MARVLHLEPEQKNFSLQEKTRATFSTNFLDGEKYFQINTYGSSTRVNTKAPSQVIQINKKTAIELITLLKAVFNI